MLVSCEVSSINEERVLQSYSKARSRWRDEEIVEGIEGNKYRRAALWRFGR